MKRKKYRMRKCHIILDHLRPGSPMAIKSICGGAAPGWVMRVTLLYVQLQLTRKAPVCKRCWSMITNGYGMERI